MKQCYPIFIFLLFFLFTPPKNYGQQYLTERLVELSIGSEEVQKYFQAFNTVFILSNDHCNNRNCRAAALNTNKKVMILNKEDIFMRNIDKWLEFITIRRKDNTAVVRFKLHKGRTTTLRAIQKNGQWVFK